MIIDYTNKELELLARIMRAEALGEGETGMLLVGNVVVNRCIANCYTFGNIRTITDAIYEKNQFSGTNTPLFEGKPTELEKRLAKKILSGEFFHPARHALWFYASQDKECSKTWYNQSLAGKYKNHCFYEPDKNICQELY